MLACEGIARLVKGIPRFPCGNAGGIGFWGLRGPLLLFFLCFLVSAGGLVFLRGFRCCCCWCCTRRFPSPRRKLSCAEGKEQIKQIRLRPPQSLRQWKFLIDPTIPTVFTLKHWTHHLFGMLFAEGCLVRDIKHGDGALLTICKFGCATCKELLGTIQQNVYREQLRKKKKKKKPAMHSTETMWTTYSSTGANFIYITVCDFKIACTTEIYQMRFHM